MGAFDSRTEKIEWTAPPERVLTDFGGLLRGTPEHYLGARDGRDVVRGMARAREEGMAITFRGAGHSCGGQTLPRSGLLLESFIPDAKIEPVDEKLVRVPGRARLFEVERALNAKGLSVPVLPDYLHLSLGGVLSVGGIGTASPRYGFLADGLESLVLIQPDGDRVHCSRERNRRIFAEAPAGLGRAGYIESAVLRVKSADTHDDILRVQCRTMDDFAMLTKRIAAWPSPPRSFNGWLSGEDLVLEAGVSPEAKEEQESEIRSAGAIQVESFERPDEPFALHDRRAAWLENFPDHLRLWSDYFFPEYGFIAFMEKLDEIRREKPDLAPSVIYVLLIRRPQDAPDFSGLPGGEGPHFSVGMYFMTPRYNPLLIANTGALSRELRELALDLGGTAYRYGWDP